MLPLQNGLLSEDARPAKKARLAAHRAAAKAAAVSSVVPDITRVLAEIKALGAGLVADVRLRHEPEP